MAVGGWMRRPHSHQTGELPGVNIERTAAMCTSRLLGFSLVVLLASPALVRAQSFLERLEKSVRAAVSKPDDTETKPENGADEEAIPERPGPLGLVGDDFGEEGKGVRVLEVRPDGAAELAGIRVGDLITSINDRRVGNLDDMADAVARHGTNLKRNPEATLRITLDREGRSQTVELKLASVVDEIVPEPPSRTDKNDAQLAPKKNTGAVNQQRPSLGVTVVPLSEEARRAHGIAVRQGVVIESLRPGSPADRAGLPIGGVIVAVDGRRIGSPEDLIASVRGGYSGQEVEISYYEGNRLFRKSIRLSPADGREEARRPTDDPPLRLGSRNAEPRPAVRGGEDRPVLRGLGRALDAIARAPGAEQPIGAVPASAEEVTLLRQQLQQMQDQLDRIQRRLAELEERLSAAP